MQPVPPPFPAVLPPTPPRSSAWPMLLLAASIAGVLLVAGVVTVLTLTRAGGKPTAVAVATSRPAPSRRASPSASPSLSAEKCVLGTWTETSNQQSRTVNGVQIHMSGAGATQTFRPDGTTVLDYGAGITYTGTLDGDTWTLTDTGQINFRYQISGTTILYTSSTPNGTATWRQNGEVVQSGPITGGSTDPETFTCSGTTMAEVAGTYAIELRRTA